MDVADPTTLESTLKYPTTTTGLLTLLLQIEQILIVDIVKL